MTAGEPKPCKDCPPDSKRPAPHPGPRCATHWRAEKKRRKGVSHETMVARTYGLAPGDYERLKEAQGGVCGICRRATGATRRLSVDHDHKTGVVRGLLCRPCNDLLGQARDNPEFFQRAITYLANPPANVVLELNADDLNKSNVKGLLAPKTNMRSNRRKGA